MLLHILKENRQIIFEKLARTVFAKYTDHSNYNEEKTATYEYM
jgi:hypothetical protein